MFLRLLLINLLVESIVGGPNILLIVADDLRPALGCYNDENAYTPHLDDLAQESIIFTGAFAQQSLCAPSRNSFLTGRRPDTLQLYDFYSYWRTSVGNFTTLPEHLKNHGYTTMSVGKIFHPGISSNKTDDYPYSWTKEPFHPYTNRYKDAPVCQSMPNSFPAKNLVCPVNVVLMPNGTLPDIETLNAARRFIHEHHTDEAPFFLAVGFAKPHIPLKYPQEYLKYHPLNKFVMPNPYAWPDKISSVAYNPWIDLRKRDDVKALFLKFPWAQIPVPFARLIIQSYYASVTYIDHLIGILINQLCTSKIRQKTIIILTSDHGWSLGEHSEWAKYSNFDVALRVPLLISIPGLTYNTDYICTQTDPVEDITSHPMSRSRTMKKTCSNFSAGKNKLKEFSMINKKIRINDYILNNKPSIENKPVTNNSETLIEQIGELMKKENEGTHRIWFYELSNDAAKTSIKESNINDEQNREIQWLQRLRTLEAGNNSEKKSLKSVNNKESRNQLFRMSNIFHQGDKVAIEMNLSARNNLDKMGKWINKSTKKWSERINVQRERIPYTGGHFLNVFKTTRYLKARANDGNLKLLVQGQNHDATKTNDVKAMGIRIPKLKIEPNDDDDIRKVSAINEWTGQVKIAEKQISILKISSEYFGNKTAAFKSSSYIKNNEINLERLKQLVNNDIEHAKNENWTKLVCQRNNHRRIREYRDTWHRSKYTKRNIYPRKFRRIIDPKNLKKREESHSQSFHYVNGLRTENLRTANISFKMNRSKIRKKCGEKQHSRILRKNKFPRENRLNKDHRGKSTHYNISHLINRAGVSKEIDEKVENSSLKLGLHSSCLLTRKATSTNRLSPMLRQKYVIVDSIVELVDLFPTIAELAGFPIPICPEVEDRYINCKLPTDIPNPCSEGVTLLPLISAATASEQIQTWKKAAFSQYPRPGVNPTLHPNSDEPTLNQIDIMGYSIRTEKYRYTAWVPFAPNSKKPNWRIIAEELYDHYLDSSENLNVENNPIYYWVKQDLRNQLRQGWRFALPEQFKVVHP